MSQHARVYLPELGGVAALVDIGPGRASAVLLARPIRSLSGAVGDRVTVEITTRRGLQQFDARIAAVTHGEELELQLLGKTEIVQRRDCVRVDAALDVTVTPIPRDRQQIHATTLNISGSGAVLGRVGALSAGDTVDLALRLGPRGPAIVTGGRVVREFRDGVRALRFERLRESERDQIVRFVFERQRFELQRLRNGS